MILTDFAYKNDLIHAGLHLHMNNGRPAMAKEHLPRLYVFIRMY